MKSYYCVMPVAKSVHADDCFKGIFISTGFGIHIDFTHILPDDWSAFNREFIPKFSEEPPGKTNVICTQYRETNEFIHPNDRKGERKQYSLSSGG